MFTLVISVLRETAELICIQGMRLDGGEGFSAGFRVIPNRKELYENHHCCGVVAVRFVDGGGVEGTAFQSGDGTLCRVTNNAELSGAKS